MLLFRKSNPEVYFEKIYTSFLVNAYLLKMYQYLFIKSNSNYFLMLNLRKTSKVPLKNISHNPAK